MLLLDQPSEPTIAEMLYLPAGLATLVLGTFVWRTSRRASRSSASADRGPR